MLALAHVVCVSAALFAAVQADCPGASEVDCRSTAAEFGSCGWLDGGAPPECVACADYTDQAECTTVSCCAWTLDNTCVRDTDVCPVDPPASTAPTAPPVQLPRCCLGLDDQWQAGFGGCPTYASNTANHDFCGQDIHKDNKGFDGCIADQVSDPPPNSCTDPNSGLVACRVCEECSGFSQSVPDTCQSSGGQTGCVVPNAQADNCAAPTVPVPTPPPTSGSPTIAPPTAVPSMPPSSQSPTHVPTQTPTVVSPTAAPTKVPMTASPTHEPTATPSSAAPTTIPSNTPTHTPTQRPSDGPTASPSSGSPTTVAPTALPTSTSPTDSPTARPTQSPTDAPTTQSPTLAPSAAPTKAPTTLGPTAVPTTEPTAAPTTVPTVAPSAVPTTSPTLNPTDAPTTASPTDVPTTGTPSVSPTARPTPTPSLSPTAQPTKTPTTAQPTPVVNDHPANAALGWASDYGSDGFIAGWTLLSLLLVGIVVMLVVLHRNPRPRAGNARMNQHGDRRPLSPRGDNFVVIPVNSPSRADKQKMAMAASPLKEVERNESSIFEAQQSEATTYETEWDAAGDLAGPVQRNTVSSPGFSKMGIQLDTVGESVTDEGPEDQDI
eukprot:m.28885 g.28885  ORF g.28885 m.28885 type:complete len:606 (-) comp4555_c0_seq1:250-2067(-)